MRGGSARALFQRTAAFQRAPSTLFLNTSRHIPGTGSCAPARRDVDRVLPPLARSCRRVLPRKRICSPDGLFSCRPRIGPYGNGQRPCRSAALTAARGGYPAGRVIGVRGTPDAEGARPSAMPPERKKKRTHRLMHPLLSLWGGCRRALPAPRPGILVRAAPNRRGVSSQ